MSSKQPLLVRADPNGSRATIIPDSIAGDITNITYVAGQNVQKLLQRGETIDALEVKAADLEMGAGRFERASAKLRSDMCWRDCRWKLLALIVLVLMIIFITLLAVLIRKHHA